MASWNPTGPTSPTSQKERNRTGFEWVAPNIENYHIKFLRGALRMNGRYPIGMNPLKNIIPAAGSGIQKRAIRLIKVGGESVSEPVSKILHIPSLLTYQLCKFIHSQIVGYGPKVIQMPMMGAARFTRASSNRLLVIESSRDEPPQLDETLCMSKELKCGTVYRRPYGISILRTCSRRN